MGVSVFGDSEKAGLYDNTSGTLIGTVYRGHADAERELTVFLNDWLEGSARDYEESVLPELFVAYKVERGFLDKIDWTSQIRTAEDALGREIKQESFNL